MNTIIIRIITTSSYIIQNLDWNDFLRADPCQDTGRAAGAAASVSQKTDIVGLLYACLLYMYNKADTHLRFFMLNNFGYKFHLYAQQSPHQQ